MSVEEFDGLFSDLRSYINQLQIEYETTKDATINAKIGKSAALVFEIKKIYVNDEKKDLTHSQRHIITHYCPRHSKENEQKRKNEFVGDTNYKQLEVYEIIKKMNGGKTPRDDFLKALIQNMKNSDNIQVYREATRSKAGLYIFLQQHIDVVKQLYENGTHFEYD